MQKRLLIGTNNPSKLHLMRSFIQDESIEIVSPADLGLNMQAPEDARDAAGNALQKAIAFHRASGLPVMTEDSGLVFLDLPMDHPDQPGVYVRRPANNAPLTDDEDMLIYYANLIHRHGGKLRAAWQDAWCILQDAEHYALHTEDESALLRHAMTMVDVPCSQRHPGWPLDSLTVSASTGRYWAEMSREDMDAVRKLEQSGAAEDRQKLLTWIREQVAKMV